MAKKSASKFQNKSKKIKKIVIMTISVYCKTAYKDMK